MMDLLFFLICNILNSWVKGFGNYFGISLGQGIGSMNDIMASGIWMTWESNLRGSSAAFPLMGRLGRISTSLGVYNVPFKDLVVEQHHQSMLWDGHHGITLGRKIDIRDHQGTLRWGGYVWGQGRLRPCTQGSCDQKVAVNFSSQICHACHAYSKGVAMKVQGFSMIFKRGLKVFVMTRMLVVAKWYLAMQPLQPLPGVSAARRLQPQRLQGVQRRWHVFNEARYTTNAGQTTLVAGLGLSLCQRLARPSKASFPEGLGWWIITCFIDASFCRIDCAKARLHSTSTSGWPKRMWKVTM